MCVIYDGRPRAQPRQQLLYHARKGARGAQESITGELFIHILFSCCFFVFQAGEVSPVQLFTIDRQRAMTTDNNKKFIKDQIN